MNYREQNTFITTVDTKKTYKYPQDETPLWRVRLEVDKVNGSGSIERYFSIAGHATEVYVEEETLRNAGVTGVGVTKKNSDDAPRETVEDLLLRLLEHVDVYPSCAQE
jgi:hypothetical protein